MSQTTNEKPSVIKRVIDAIEWVLVLAAAGLAIYVMVNASQGKAVKFFGNSLLHIVTGSMEPTVTTGDYIYIKDVEISDLKVGDIVAYYSEDPEIKGKLVLHRIVNINPDGTYQTMGDANPIPDRIPVRADQIAGRYAGRAGLFNWFASFVSPQKLLLLAVVIPLFLLSIYEAGTVAKIFVNARKEGLEKDDPEDEIERVKREAIEAYLAEQAAAESGGSEAEPKTAEPEAEDATEPKNAEPEAKDATEPKTAEPEAEDATESETAEPEANEEAGPKGVTGQDEQDEAKDE